MSLRIKTFISFLLITLLPSGILLSLYYYEARSHFETMAFDTLRDEAKTFAERLDALIAFNVDTIKHLSYDVRLPEFLLTPDEELPDFRMEINRWLDVQIAVNTHLYSALYVMNSTGICLASSQRNFIGQDYSFRPYFQEAMQGKVALTDLFVGVTSNLPGIYTAAPIVYHENIMGVIVLKFNADGIFQSVDKRSDDTINWFVLNHMGIILTHTNPQYRYTSLTPLSAAEKTEIQQIQQFAHHTPESLNVPELHHALLGEQLTEATTHAYSFDNISRIGGFAPLETEAWIVGVSKPTDDMYAFLSDLTYTTVLIAIFSLIVIGITAYGLSTYVLIKPLTRLLNGVKRIQQGHYAHRIPMSSKDEIGQLARAFNTMAQSLQHSEQDYRTLFETLPVGVYRTSADPQGPMLRANPAIVEMFGLHSMQEFTQFPIADLYQYPESRTHFLETISTEGSVKNMELAFKKKNGEMFWGATTATISYDEHGQMRWIDGIINDISEQKHAELELQKYREQLEMLVEERTRALQESEQRFSSFMNHLPEIAFITDCENRLVYINAFGADIFGITFTKGNSYALHDVFSTERTQDYIKHHQHILLHGQAIQFEEEFPDSSGYRYWLTYKFPIYRESGPPAFVGSISMDITDRKQTEEALCVARLTAEEARRVAEEAQRAAESANQAKSVFLANMSHELRTPLNAILGFTQLFQKDGTLTKSHQQAIKIIHQSGEYLLALINDVLDLSKIEANRLELQPTPFNLRESLSTIIEMMGLRAEQKGLAFHYTLAPDIPVAVSGDERRLRQIILNLLSNAIKFTEDGSITFKVTKASTAEYDHLQSSISTLNSQMCTLRLEISDTGIGIPQEKLDEIFEPFQQVKNPTIKSEGTGLGLPISRQLVALMGGELRVRSTPGKGTVFWFDLIFPLATTASAAQGPIKLSAINIQSINGYHGRQRKILLVDDRLHDRMVLKATLLPLGFNVSEAINGQEAIQQATIERPDVILMDLVLPDIDGTEVFRRIQHISVLQNVVIIAVSANVDPQNRQQCVEMGFHGFLPKPVPLDILLHLLQQYLKLEWRYRDMELKQNRRTLQTGFLLPPCEKMQHLFQLAKRGNPNEITLYIETLARQNPSLEPFTQQIREWLESYQIDQIYKYIQSCLEKENL